MTRIYRDRIYRARRLDEDKATVANRFDLYHPCQNGRAPCIVIYRTGGDGRAYERLALRLASGPSPVVVVLANCNVGHPTDADDARECMIYVDGHARLARVDNGDIYVAGVGPAAVIAASVARLEECEPRLIDLMNSKDPYRDIAQRIDTAS